MTSDQIQLFKQSKPEFEEGFHFGFNFIFFGERKLNQKWCGQFIAINIDKGYIEEGIIHDYKDGATGRMRSVQENGIRFDNKDRGS